MKPTATVAFVLLVLVFLLVTPRTATAQIHLERDVVAAGAGAAAGPGLRVEGTVGQAAIGLLGSAVAGAQIGFWHSLGVLSSVPGGSLHAPPSRFELTSLGPNPAAATAHLRFGTPRPGRVSIRLYNVAGREVRCLADDDYGAGWHQIDVDSSGLPSGVYLCRMSADGYTQTRRFILSK